MSKHTSKHTDQKNINMLYEAKVSPTATTGNNTPVHDPHPRMKGFIIDAILSDHATFRLLGADSTEGHGGGEGGDASMPIDIAFTLTANEFFIPDDDSFAAQYWNKSGYNTIKWDHIAMGLYKARNMPSWHYLYVLEARNFKKNMDMLYRQAAGDDYTPWDKNASVGEMADDLANALIG